jgi:hypothetical protein
MSWIKNSMLVIISTIVTIKGADVLIGYSAPEVQFPVDRRGVERYILLSEINPNFKAKYIPSDEYLKSTDSLERKGYLVKTDRDGFIENGNNINFTENDESIIFFGGSTTEQLFVDEEYRWQSILERKLNEGQRIPKLKIINAGVSGNNSMHSTVNLIAKGLPLKPKFVVLMHNVNDYSLLSLSGSYWKSPVDRALLQIKDKSSLRPFMVSIKDAFVPNIYEIYQIVKYKISNKDDFNSIRDEEIVGLEIVESNFRKSLNTFIDLSLTWGIEPVLMTQFNRINSEDELFKSMFYGQDIEQYIKGYARLNDVIREVSVNRKVDLIDLDKLVPSTSDYIYDSVHLNENGSKLVADIIINYWNNNLTSTK